MGKRVGKTLLLVLGILVSFGYITDVIYATGTGTQSDPFIVHELTMDARFVSEGAGTLTINGVAVGDSKAGTRLEKDNIQLNNPDINGISTNTISIYSNIYCDLCNKFTGCECDCTLCDKCSSSCGDTCGFNAENDHAMAVFRIGSDSDNNIIYTQRDGWSVPGGGTINEAPASSCYFWNAKGSIDFPWTDQEKCVNTKPAGYTNCAFLNLSKTFYVKKCDCTTSGSCCYGCNYLPAGTDCGTAACPSSVSYHNDGSTCHKVSYVATSCTKTCDGSGNCNDCCSSQDVVQGWTCGECQQKNPSSCSGSTGPLCGNLAYGTPCTDDGNPCTNDICSSGACTHPGFCAGTDASCGCTTCTSCNQDGWVDTGTWNYYSCKRCKPQEYRDYYCSSNSCIYTVTSNQNFCENINEGQSCATSLSQTGTCNSGNCQANPSLSASISLQPNTITVGSTATLSGTVTCSNTNCGNVYVYPKSSKGGENPINNVPGLRVQCGTVNCEYPCGYMNAGGSCNPSWSITGTSTGTYPLFLRIISDNPSLSTQTDTVYLYVNEIPAGTISATLSAEPSTVTAGSVTSVRAMVSCSGTSENYCGNVTFYLLYNGIPMKTTGNLFTASQNPSSYCSGLWGGGACEVIWQVNASKNDTYTLSAIADSDYRTNTYDVYNATAQTQLTVNEKPVGVLSVENLYMNPENQTIVLEGSARLGTDIRCASSADNPAAVSCGTVKAYPTFNGAKIVQSGNLTTANTEKDCGVMDSSSRNVCHVYWDITGKSLGSYALAINANSNSSDTWNITSESMMLEVTKNLGTLSASWIELKPNKINLTSPASTAKLSVALGCTTNDCGKVNVSLWLDGEMLTSSSNVGAQQNIQSCSSFPCYRNWTLSGNSEGSFKINIMASSNESIQQATNETTLIVTDPKKPLLNLISNLGSVGISLGQTVQIRANVSCLVKDCGETEVSLQYNAGGWNNIGSSGNAYLASQSRENPVRISLAEGNYSESLWNVNFTQAGVYELRISATGSAPNITNDEDVGNITVSNITGSVQILSPKPNQKFMRGDSVSVKVGVAGDGNPMTGLMVKVPELNATLYDDGVHNDGDKDDGIYGGSGRVPADATGQYGLTVRAESFSNTTYISISSLLYVTVRTDGKTYTWGEVMGISGEITREAKGEKAPANVTIVLTHGKDSSWKHEITLNATEGYFSYNYSNRDTPNINGTLMIEASAKDSYANSGQSSTSVTLKAAEGVQKIDFLMSKYNYMRGENVTVAVKPADNGKSGSIREMSCTLSGSVTKTLVLKGGTYYGNYTIPTDMALGKRSLSCSFTGTESGTGYKEITVEPMKLNISIISPQPQQQGAISYIPVVSTEPVELTAAVFYPDNTPVTDGTVEITVAGKRINMTRTSVPGIYSASGVIFTKDRSGAAMSSMFLTAQDAHNNSGNNEVNVIVDSGQFNWWWLLLIPAGLVILFFGYFYMRSKEPPQIQIQEKIIRLPVRERVREIVYRPIRMPAPERRVDPATRLREEIARLEERQRIITNAKDLAEQQYYKRQIDEATFNKLMQNYEEKLIEIDAAVRQKRKELGMGPV